MGHHVQKGHEGTVYIGTSTTQRQCCTQFTHNVNNNTTSKASRAAEQVNLYVPDVRPTGDGREEDESNPLYCLSDDMFC